MKCLRLIILFLIFFSSNAIGDKIKSANNWENIVKGTKDKTVRFHAWGGSSNINNYINWVTKKVEEKYGIKLIHVKLKDTSDAVKKILFEKIAQKQSNGSVDILWVNGENFLTMKKNSLLLKESWITNLPNSKFINLDKNSPFLYDFGVYNEGKEMPWGLSQLIFYYDSANLFKVPKSANELMDFIKKNPGRVTFPQPPDFIGTSFIKQILLDISSDTSNFYRKFDAAKDQMHLKDLWNWFDEATPYLWKNGKVYPGNYLSMAQLFSDNEIDLGITFNISFPRNEIMKGNFKPSVRSFIPTMGSLANTHFLTIPYNSGSLNASKIVINFLISPEAQIKKQDPKIWGDPTVLSISKLDKSDKQKFDKYLKNSTDLSYLDLEKKLPEPHPSWVKVIEESWIKKYGSKN